METKLVTFPQTILDKITKRSVFRQTDSTYFFANMFYLLKTERDHWPSDAPASDQMFALNGYPWSIRLIEIGRTELNIWKEMIYKNKVLTF